MAEPFTIEHFRGWARSLRLDSGDPWELEPFQVAFVEDVFAGFRECWLVIPEGNGKTTTLAGLGLYHCQFTEAGSVPIAASSRDQAEVMYRQAESFVRMSPSIRGLFKCQEGYRRVKCESMGSRIQVFAADDRTGDGIIPTLALLDELHRHRDLRLYRTWRGKLDKRDGQLATISTAGEPGGEFEETRELIRVAAEEIVRDGSFVRAVSGGVVLHDWAVPEDADVEDLAVVKAANPFSGVTVEQLGEKRRSPTMTLSHWRRFTCNLPTRADHAAITENEWYQAALPAGSELPAEPAWLGLDVGWKWDTTALVPFWLLSREERVLGPATVLEPPRDGSSLDPHLVERALVEHVDRYGLHTVVMDMSKAEQLAAWIEEELGLRVVDRPQGNAKAAEEYRRFMEALREGWLRHSGDRELTRHAMNAVARVLPYGDAVFDRPSRTRQGGDQDMRVIDALKAASMVNATADGDLEAVEPFVMSW